MVAVPICVRLGTRILAQRSAVSPAETGGAVPLDPLPPTEPIPSIIDATVLAVTSPLVPILDSAWYLATSARDLAFSASTYARYSSFEVAHPARTNRLERIAAIFNFFIFPP